MKVVIFAGGYGTRLSELTHSLPKPMIEVGGIPLLLHIMDIYAASGYDEFVVACGYRAGVVKEYFLNRFHDGSSLNVDMKTGEFRVIGTPLRDYNVTLVDTGIDTETAARLSMVREFLPKGEPFLLTYGDGVSDINFPALLAYHSQHKAIATITAVRPMSRFGELTFFDDKRVGLVEKPQLDTGYINGGFMVCEYEVMEMVNDHSGMFEKDVLMRLSDRGNLGAYQHNGFWMCVDTLRDKKRLEELYAEKCPWPHVNRQS